MPFVTIDITEVTLLLGHGGNYSAVASVSAALVGDNATRGNFPMTDNLPLVERLRLLHHLLQS